jgi:DNA-binding GntR family transcriptional regulator
MEQIQVPPSKTDLCYDSLHTAILHGDLKPGSRIVIDELARQMGVSAIPIREALQRLQSEGLVEVQPHVGVRVADIDSDSIYEIFELKEALEIISGRAACQRMSDEDLQHAEGILRTMDRVLDDHDRWSEENVHFHEFVCQCAGMPLVGHLMRQVLGHWGRLRRHYHEEVFVERHVAAHQEHWAMLRALRTGDPDRIEKVTRDHNRSSIAAYTWGPDAAPRERETIS